MFKLTDKFWWPVVLEMPGDGASQKHRIELQFVRKTQAELDRLSEDRKTDEEICLEVVCGWKGVRGEDDQDLPFTQDNLRRLLDEVAGARFAIASTWFDAMQGAARRKNLPGLRGIG